MRYCDIGYEDFDTVRIYFEDGTETVMQISYDDDIATCIAYLCEAEGYPPIINYSIE